MDVGIAAREPSSEPHFDLAVNEVSAQAFFTSLSDGTRYNMIVHPNVSGKISLKLKDVTVSEVLQVVNEVYGYPIRRTKRGFTVMPIALQTRIFEIDYLNVERLGGSETRVSSGQVGEGSSSEASSSSGSDRRSVTGTRIETRSDANFWGDLVRALEAVVGKADGRSVVVTPHTGIAIVRAMPDELNSVEEFLSATQRILERQVILEAKILEVELNDNFQAGINWSQLIVDGDQSVLFGQTGGGSSLANGFSDISGETFNLDPRNADLVETAVASAFGGVFTMAFAFDKFSAIVELLETQGTVRTLSTPRVSTLNNQKAVIKVGSDEFFVTDISTTTVQGTTTTTNPNVELTPFFSGIALDVTPQISSDGEVILHIHPSISQVEEKNKKIEIGSSEGSVSGFTIPLAFSRIRESDSVVRARSGQMIVIGGLMENRQFDRRAATPWLGRIPFLGSLFRQQATGDRKSELVILLRPIVVGANTWRGQISRIENRVESLNGQVLNLESDELSTPTVVRDRGE
jgi:MSHA biogenesis protein MshL